MDTKNYENFQKCWEKFKNQVQGQMMMQAKKDMFTFASLNLILKSSVDFWDSRYSEGGRWLDGLEKEHPEQAGLIRNILLNDMKFTEASTEESKGGVLKYVVPAGTAVAGFAMSKAAGFNKTIQALCTVAPAVASYPITNNIMNTMEDNRKMEKIQAYIGQLDKYKQSIESILRDIEA